MTLAYIRCNEGHYFLGEYCPFDGWSSVESKQLAELTEAITSGNNELSIEQLKKHGVSDATLSRTIIINFGEGNFVFDGILPDGYIIEEKYLRLRDLPAKLL